MDMSIGAALNTIGTLAAAVATAVMARLTYQTVKESKDQRIEATRRFEDVQKRDQQHHQDQFRPLLMVAFGDGAPADRLNIVTTSSPTDTSPAVYVRCSVQNIGVGPALNVRLSVRKDGITGFGPTRELAPIAAKGILTGSDGRFRLPVIYHDGLRDADLPGLPGSLWVLVLEYEDVFGKQFHTLHRKDQGATWAKANAGLAPDTTPRLPAASLLAPPVALAESDIGPGPPM
jgi:hypothetical protein